MIDGLAQDIRFAFRTLRKAPGFTTAAVITLALGIGANTVIFSLVNAVLIRSLPYKDASRLVLVRERIPKLIKEPIPVSPADVDDFAQQSHSFDGIGAFQSNERDIAGKGDPDRVFAGEVSYTLLPLLGVNPMLGRTFTEQEDRSRAPVVVLGYRVWQERFGGDRNVVGKVMFVDRKPHTVIGVMPEGFAFPEQGVVGTRPPEFWMPGGLYGKDLVRGDDFDIGILAHLKSGVTTVQASEDVFAIAKRIQKLYPPALQTQISLEALVVPLQQEVVGDTRSMLILLSAAVGCLLLIGCANVANLLLSRAAGRQRETAIRIALGAARGRIIRQMLTESCVLALAGCAAGLVIAAWGIDLLIPALKANMPRTGGAHLDWTVLGFTVALSICTGLLFGISPALAAWHTNANDRLKEGSKGSAGLHRNRLQRALVILETATAMVLLVSSGLLVRSFLNVANADPGFRPEHLLSFGVSASRTAYQSVASQKAFFETVQARIAGLPGIHAVGAGTDMPILGSRWTRVITPEGYNFSANKLPLDNHTLVMGDYFRAMGFSLKAGRFFDQHDSERKDGVVIVSDTLAKRFWPGQSAVGKRIKFGSPEGQQPWQTIVGVVGDAADDRIDREARPHTYVPFTVSDENAGFASRFAFAVRSSANTATLSSAIRALISSIDRQAPVTEMQTMTTALDKSKTPRRLNTWIMVLFAATALVLAAIGIYGVLAYSVTQRTQEIGIRVALGARTGNVVGMVVKQGLALALSGIVIGLAAAAALTHLMSSMLFGVEPKDPVTFAAVALFLAGVAFLASYLPARRASRVDPMIALRYE